MKWEVGDRFVVKSSVVSVTEGSRAWSGHVERIVLEGGETGTVIFVRGSSINVDFDGTIYRPTAKQHWCSVSANVFEHFVSPGWCAECDKRHDAEDYLCPDCRRYGS